MELCDAAEVGVGGEGEIGRGAWRGNGVCWGHEGTTNALCAPSRGALGMCSSRSARGACLQGVSRKRL